MDNLPEGFKMIERRAMPEGWEWKRLIEVLLSLENGARPKGGVDNIEEGVPSVGGEHLNKDGGFIFDTMKFIPTEFYENMKRGRIKNGDVLVVKDGATTGKVSLVRDDYPYQESAVNEHVFICRPNQKYVMAEYLFYNLFSPLGKNKILRSFHGAAQGGINTQFANDYEIPLPPLPTQRRIVSILEKAEETKRLRAQADELTDRLLQSVFLEMFGDPVKNPKGWEIKQMGTEIRDIRYGTGSPPEYQKDGVPFIRATNIKKGTVQKDGLVFISKEEANKIQKCEVKTGDLILVRSGVNTGDCARIPPEYDGAYAAYDLIIQMPYPKNYYYNFIINSDYGNSVIKPLSRRAGQPHINADQVKSLQFPLPLDQLLEKFASIVEKIESMRSIQAQSKQQIEDLFSALMQKAFRGELET
jgi:type I restriction enzyme S subunit